MSYSSGNGSSRSLYTSQPQDQYPLISGRYTTSTPEARKTSYGAQIVQWFKDHPAIIVVLVSALLLLGIAMWAFTQSLTALTSENFNHFSAVSWAWGKWSFWTIALFAAIFSSFAILLALVGVYLFYKEPRTDVDEVWNLLNWVIRSSLFLCFCFFILALVGYIGYSRVPGNGCWCSGVSPGPYMPSYKESGSVALQVSSVLSQAQVEGATKSALADVFKVAPAALTVTSQSSSTPVRRLLAASTVSYWKLSYYLSGLDASEDGAVRQMASVLNSSSQGQAKFGELVKVKFIESGVNATLLDTTYKWLGFVLDQTTTTQTTTSTTTTTTTITTTTSTTTSTTSTTTTITTITTPFTAISTTASTSSTTTTAASTTTTTITTTSTSSTTTTSARSITTTTISTTSTSSTTTTSASSITTTTVTTTSTSSTTTTSASSMTTTTIITTRTSSTTTTTTSMSTATITTSSTRTSSTSTTTTTHTSARRLGNTLLPDFLVITPPRRLQGGDFGSQCREWNGLNTGNWCYVSKSSACAAVSPEGDRLKSSEPCAPSYNLALYPRFLDGKNKFTILLWSMFWLALVLLLLGISVILLSNFPSVVRAFRLWWANLHDNERSHAASLGYTQNTWDNDTSIPIRSKTWSQMAQDEQFHAANLGYDADTWGEGRREVAYNLEDDYVRAKQEVVDHLQEGHHEALKIEFYGLYNQIERGDCTMPEPNIRDGREVMKWNAWMKLRGHPRADLMRQYIELAASLH